MDDRPFSNHELNDLLAEIIKAANLPQALLLNFIHQHSPPPIWGNVVPPPGRTANNCRSAFEALNNAHSMRAPPGPQTPSPMSATIPPTLKRPFPYADSGYTAGRVLHPKPPAGGGVYEPPPIPDQLQRKKRGRPTKAAALARAEAQAAGAVSRQQAEATVGPHMAAPAFVPQPPDLRPSLSSMLQPFAEPSRSTPYPTSRVSIHSMVTPTVPTASASQSSSSSGKRRRRTRSDPEDQPSGSTEVQPESQLEEYRSPYARMGPTSPDVSARPAPGMRQEGAGQDEGPQGRQRDTPESGDQATSPTHPASNPTNK